MYKQAAGQIGDPTTPNSIKLAAIETVRKIQARYAGGGQQTGGATGGGEQPSAAPGPVRRFNPATGRIE
jgi:hypothetical protein